MIRELLHMIPPKQIQTLPVEIHDEGEQIFSQIWKLGHMLNESEIKELCMKHGVCCIDGVLCTKEEKVFIPDDEAICLFIMKLCHDSPVSGHPGYEKFSGKVTVFIFIFIPI